MAPFATLVDSWASLYANSAAMRTAVSFAHVGGLVAGGGCAIAADRAVLMAAGAGRQSRTFSLASVRAVHRLVLVGLTLVVLSGLLLLGADLEAYLESSAFWIKMGLFVALLANGALFVRAERRAERDDEGGWGALRLCSILSLFLWLATTLAGAALPNAL